MPTAVVIHDVVNSRRVTSPPDRYPPVYRYVRAFKGDRIELSTEELERLEALGSVAREEDAEQALADADAAAAPFEAGQAGDDAIASLKVEDAIAYVTQNPGEAERVARIERQRGRGPRKGVLAATGFDADGELVGPPTPGQTTPAGAAGPGGALNGAQANPDGSPDPNPSTPPGA